MTTEIGNEKYKLTVELNKNEYNLLNEYIEYNGLNKTNLIRSYIRTLSINAEKTNATLESKIETLINSQSSNGGISKEDIQDISKSISESVSTSLKNQSDVINRVIDTFNDVENEELNLNLKVDRLQGYTRTNGSDIKDSVDAVLMMLSAFIVKLNKDNLEDFIQTLNTNNSNHIKHLTNSIKLSVAKNKPQQTN